MNFGLLFLIFLLIKVDANRKKGRKTVEKKPWPKGFTEYDWEEFELNRKDSFRDYNIGSDTPENELPPTLNKSGMAKPPSLLKTLNIKNPEVEKDILKINSKLKRPKQQRSGWTTPYDHWLHKRQTPDLKKMKQMNGGWYTVDQVLQDTIMTTIGALVDLKRYEPMCAVGEISPDYLITAAQCCANVGIKQGTYVIFFHHKMGNNLFDLAESAAIGAVDIAGGVLDLFPFGLGSMIAGPIKDALRWAFGRIAKVDPVRMYYPPEFLKTHRGDICVILNGDISNRTYEPTYPNLITRSRVNVTRRKDFYLNYENKKCFVYSYDAANTIYYVVVPIKVLSKAQCVNQGRFPYEDEFCARPTGNTEGLTNLMIGGNVHCDGTLVGVLVFNDRYHDKDRPPVYIIQRYDFHEPFINSMRTDMPRTRGIDYTSEKTESTQSTEETNIFERAYTTPAPDASWTHAVRILKWLAIQMAVILLLGIIIRSTRVAYKMVVRNCCGVESSEKLWKNRKLHPRMVTPFFVVVISVLGYIFQYAKRKDKPKRISRQIKQV